MTRYTVKAIRRNEVVHIVGHVNLYFPGTGPLHCIYDNEAGTLLLNKAFKQKAIAEKEADFLNKKEADNTADREVYAVRGDKEFRLVKQLTPPTFYLDLSGYHFVLTGSRIVRIKDVTQSGKITAEPVKMDGSHGGELVYLDVYREPVYLLHARYREGDL